MSMAKKYIAVLLTALLIFGSCAIIGSAEDAPAAFTTVLRFIAASDTHVRDDSDLTVRRIEKMLHLGDAAAGGDPAHPTLDAVVIAGDLTNDGTKTEFEKFSRTVNGSLRDGTRFLGVVAKNHDGYKMRRAELRSVFTALTGCNADFHEVICGFHFIGVSASAHDLLHYDAGQLRWLKAQLDAAVADDPDKPIFVFHHEHVLDTVYGSTPYDMWGVPYFTSILKQYPQVVDFSGHSHYPLNDPRSVWQDDFTAIGTGAIYYTEFRVDATRSAHPGNAYDVATCWIAEVDAAGNLCLRGMDVNAGEALCEYRLDNPADPANRALTPAKQKAASTAPVFAPGDALRVTEQNGKCILQIPAAASTDGTPVVLYRIRIRNARGSTVCRDWALPDYYLAGEQDVVEHTLRGVPAGSYTVEAAAETAWGVSSAPLTAQAQTAHYVCPYCGQCHDGVQSILTILLHRMIFAIRKVTG